MLLPSLRIQQKSETSRAKAYNPAFFHFFGKIIISFFRFTNFKILKY